MNASIASKTEGLNEKLLRTQGIREQRMLLSLATPAVLAIVAIVVIPARAGRAGVIKQMLDQYQKTLGLHS